MTENHIDLQIDFPGKEYARVGYDLASGNLKLLEVVYPETFLPVDLCSVLSTRTEEDTTLPALLIRNVSLAPGSRVTARPIGLSTYEQKAGRPILLCVPVGDTAFDQVNRLEDLPEPGQNQVKDFLQTNTGETGLVLIEDAETAWKVISAARKRYRLQHTKRNKHGPAAPAWQPDSAPTLHRSSGETELHTESEYGYWQLPRRFQKYIEAYLQSTERVLLTVHRPAMRSALVREFLTGKRLEESVLIITDRQITLVEEKTPPGQSDVNYGYIAYSGAPERLVAVQNVPVNQDVIGLRLAFQASTGIQTLAFEFPAYRAGEIDQAVTLLTGWLPVPEDKRLRRAVPQNIPDRLPLLTDPSGNDPEEMKSTSLRFEEELTRQLQPDEQILDWCLFPAWLAAGAGKAHVLAITNRRSVIFPDNGDEQAVRWIPHHLVASMEYSSTYMGAHLSLYLPRNGSVRRETIRFSKTMAEMDRCFHSLQQAIAVVQLAT